jgi:hypothetical protein
VGARGTVKPALTTEEERTQAVSHINGRTLSLSLGLLLALSGCVVHVHEKGEAETGSSSSSGGESSVADRDDHRPRKPVADKDDDKPAKPVADKDDDKPAKPVADKDDDKPAKPVADKPVGKPVVVDSSNPMKPGAGKDDDKPTKPVADKPASPGGKPVIVDSSNPMKPGAGKDTVVKPGNNDAKPVADKPAMPGGKPVIADTVKPVKDDDKEPVAGTDKPKDPQRTEGDPADKSAAISDRPLSYSGEGEKKPRVVVDATKDSSKVRRPSDTGNLDGRINAAAESVRKQPRGATEGKDKPAVVAANESIKGDAAKAQAIAAIGDADGACKLFSATADAGAKVRLRVTGLADEAQVLLDDEALKVLKRDEKAWVVQLDNDAKSGRVTVKLGDKSVSCGKLKIK